MYRKPRADAYGVGSTNQTGKTWKSDRTSNSECSGYEACEQRRNEERAIQAADPNGGADSSEQDGHDACVSPAERLG
jgi:hypothetical protein